VFLVNVNFFTPKCFRIETGSEASSKEREEKMKTWQRLFFYKTLSWFSRFSFTSLEKREENLQYTFGYKNRGVKHLLLNLKKMRELSFVTC
jgi:hypothetical protein